MDIAKLIERQQAVLAEAAGVVRKGGTPAALLARPLALHAANADRIGARIAALEGEKKAVTARIDDEIKALKGELKGVEERIAIERQNFAPALKASDAVPVKPRPSGAAKPAAAARGGKKGK